MRNYVGHHRALTSTDFLELALGTPLELWLGEEAESEQDRAVREAAARDILADDPTLYDRTIALAAETLGQSLPDLLRLAPVVPSVAVRRRRRKGLAA
ncbi:hypothetical protein [Streptomyces sp. RKAG337]|uniref:hypothetical protein n=1 Tax=Streptomyces sp. RKAG337 TaxID=2893404 RepID=UPI0020340438|nr:hypothetical protein [Streptomyces sp. RKAG337]MCM2427552.1 hypothetical protein [Streptomyces sp. RKAG337]